MHMNFLATGFYYAAGDRIELRVEAVDSAINGTCPPMATPWTTSITSRPAWAVVHPDQPPGDAPHRATLGATNFFDPGVDLPAPPPMPAIPVSTSCRIPVNPILWSRVCRMTGATCSPTGKSGPSWLRSRMPGGSRGIPPWFRTSASPHLDRSRHHYVLRHALTDSIPTKPTSRFTSPSAGATCTLPGWNLISLPVARLTCMLRSTSRCAHLFAFDPGTGGFYSPAYLQTGVGYWVLMDHATCYNIEGR